MQPYVLHAVIFKVNAKEHAVGCQCPLASATPQAHLQDAIGCEHSMRGRMVGAFQQVRLSHCSTVAQLHQQLPVWCSHGGSPGFLRSAVHGPCAPAQGNSANSCVLFCSPCICLACPQGNGSPCQAVACSHLHT